MHLHIELIKERRGIGFFTAIAKVDGKVVCDAEIMCARREA
jgi:3-hydroxyacyl-[acyl-carrier-protein] dehydratase